MSYLIFCCLLFICKPYWLGKSELIFLIIMWFLFGGVSSSRPLYFIVALPGPSI